MGSCASAHKGAVAGPAASSVKHSGESAEEKTTGDFGSAKLGGGSKDEAFFDTRGWLDSDCDDDFFSVNGDFTPSRGSTPSRRMSAISTPTLTDSASEEPSPTTKKRLSDLLQEAYNDQNAMEEHAERPLKLQQQLPPATPPSGGGDVSPVRSVPAIKSRKDKSWSPARCCMPNLVYSLGFEERRHKIPPPAYAV